MPKHQQRLCCQKLMTYNSTCECMKTVGWYSYISGQNQNTLKKHPHKWRPVGDRRDLGVCLFYQKKSYIIVTCGWNQVCGVSPAMMQGFLSDPFHFDLMSILDQWKILQRIFPLTTVWWWRLVGCEIIHGWCKTIHQHWHSSWIPVKIRSVIADLHKR